MGRNRPLILEYISLKRLYAIGQDEMRYVIDYTGLPVQSGTITLGEALFYIPLDPSTHYLATGLEDWSSLTLSAVSPKRLAYAPMTVDLELCVSYSDKTYDDIYKNITIPEDVNPFMGS